MKLPERVFRFEFWIGVFAVVGLIGLVGVETGMHFKIEWIVTVGFWLCAPVLILAGLLAVGTCVGLIADRWYARKRNGD